MRQIVTRTSLLILMTILVMTALQKPAEAASCPTTYCASISNYCRNFCGYFEVVPQGTCTASDGSTKNWAIALCGQCGNVPCWY